MINQYVVSGNLGKKPETRNSNQAKEWLASHSPSINIPNQKSDLSPSG